MSILIDLSTAAVGSVTDTDEPPLDPVLGDLDEDGMPDLAFSLKNTNRIVVLRNSTPPPVISEKPPCPADCDQNKTVDFNDLVCTLFSFGLSGIEADRIDCDNSGVIDFNDLICTLFLFGPCPE